MLSLYGCYDLFCIYVSINILIAIKCLLRFNLQFCLIYNILGYSNIVNNLYSLMITVFILKDEITHYPKSLIHSNLQRNLG